MICYQDTVTFVKVTPGGYGNNKTVSQQAEVNVIFEQDTGFSHSNFQDAVDSDAICRPDPTNAFVIANFNRLEGMYILAPLFGAANDPSWYKVTDVIVNRDTLLNNEIDNIELGLKKTSPIPGVS